MGAWLTILTTVLPFILKFLQALLDKKEQLKPSEVAKMNKVLWQMKEINQLASRVGCTFGGVKQ